jgi:cytochrome c-type biogenesis protein CcmH/NrfG
MSSLQAIRDAIEQSPDNISLLLLYSRACLEQLHLDDAHESFARVLELDPQQTDAHLGIARVLFLQGETSGAAVRAERVLQQEPDNAPAHLLLSRVYLSEGNRPKAIEHFDRAALIDGTMSDPALERELGRSARDVRRTSPAPITPEASVNEGPEDGDQAQDL